MTALISHLAAFMAGGALGFLFFAILSLGRGE
ncbi:MAG: hypothetical protein RLZZ09_802 [Pseudomonadota bacterium]